MSCGDKEYLHHEGKVIPGDFQQQRGFRAVLAVPLVLPQSLPVPFALLPAQAACPNPKRANSLW